MRISQSRRYDSRSLNPKAKLGYFDGQRGVKDDDIQRVTLGGEVYLYKLLDLGLQYRINFEQAKEKNNELLSQVHIFF